MNTIKNGVHEDMNKFWERYNYYIKNNLRKGQSMYNALHDVSPTLASSITGTNLDPFFNDRNIDKFLEYIGDKI